MKVHLIPYFYKNPPQKTKALSLILRNRALDDQTIIPPGYSCSKAHLTYDTFKIKSKTPNH